MIYEGVMFVEREDAGRAGGKGAEQSIFPCMLALTCRPAEVGALDSDVLVASLGISSELGPPLSDARAVEVDLPSSDG